MDHREKGEELSSSLARYTLSPPNQDITQTSLLNKSVDLIVHALSIDTIPSPNGNQDPSNIQNVFCSPDWIGPLPPPIATCPTTSAKNTSQEDRLSHLEVEASCASPRVDEESKDDMIEEPKSGMKFNCFEDLQSYYKKYAKKQGFGMKIQRSESTFSSTTKKAGFMWLKFFLHMLVIIYRDLKPEIVLVSDDGHIMLSDFAGICLTHAGDEIVAMGVNEFLYWIVILVWKLN